MIRSRRSSKGWHRENSSLSVPPAAFSLHNSWIIESNQFRMAASLLFPNPCPLHKYKLWRFPFISFRALSFFLRSLRVSPSLGTNVSSLCRRNASHSFHWAFLYILPNQSIFDITSATVCKKRHLTHTQYSPLYSTPTATSQPPHPSDIHSHTKKRSIRTFVFFFSTDSY